MNSDWDVVPHQRNLELSSSEVNGGTMMFRVKQCFYHEERFELVSRYLVSMINTGRPRTLLIRDINIKVPLELY